MVNVTVTVEQLTRDWRRLRAQKCRDRGGVEAAMLLDYCLYMCMFQAVQVQKQIVTRAFRAERDKNKLNIMVPLARRAIDRKIGRLWSIAHKYRATPNTKDPLAMDHADLLSEQLIPATDFKASQDSLRWQLFKWLTVCGVVFEHIDYEEDGYSQDEMPKYDKASGEILWLDTLTGREVPKSVVEQMLFSGRVPMERFTPATEVIMQGDFGHKIIDPFRVFVDATVGKVCELGPYQRIHLCEIRPIEELVSLFGSDVRRVVKPQKDLNIMETTMLDRGLPLSGLNLKDLLPLVQGTHDKDDPEMVIFITSYQPGNEEDPNGRREFWVPDQFILDQDECPYPEVPVVDYHYSAPGDTMWTEGFIRDMHSLNKFINRRVSQMGEAANSQIYEMLLLGGDLKKKDVMGDLPNAIENAISDEGVPLVQAMQRANLPSFFPDSVRMSMEMFESVSSSDLLSQRKFPGQLRGSLALPVLQEIMDSEDGPRFSHLAEQFAREKQMRINRIKQFYPPVRTMNYTGQDNRSEVLEFHASKVLRAGVDFTVTIDPGSVFPEFSMMREARIRERFQWAPGLYTSPRTGQVDWSAIAQDLKYNDRMRESKAAQGRKLARQLLRRCQQGKLVTQVDPSMPDQKTGRPKVTIVDSETSQPFVVFPFWDHNAMMDEYEAEMNTTEFIDASPLYRRVVMALYDQHRQILSAIDQARQNSVESKMVQGAVAQATQQAAAKAASMAVEASLEQVMAQQQEAGPGFEGLEARVRQLLGEAQGPGPSTARRPGLSAQPQRQLPSPENPIT